MKPPKLTRHFTRFAYTGSCRSEIGTLQVYAEGERHRPKGRIFVTHVEAVDEGGVEVQTTNAEFERIMRAVEARRWRRVKQ